MTRQFNDRFICNCIEIHMNHMYVASRFINAYVHKIKLNRMFLFNGKLKHQRQYFWLINESLKHTVLPDATRFIAVCFSLPIIIYPFYIQ